MAPASRSVFGELVAASGPKPADGLPAKLKSAVFIRKLLFSNGRDSEAV
jgi:hypothetical protein